MKTRKAKKSKPGKMIKPSRSEPGLVLTAGGDYRDEGFDCWPRPTELELAQLAARLARGDKHDAKQLVEDAWAIYWESCQKIQDDHRAVKASLEKESLADAALDELAGQSQPAVPRPKKYPVRFREMEILLLPKQKGRTANRASLIREYLLSECLGRTCMALRPKPHPLTYWELDVKALNGLREHFSVQVATRFGHLRASHFSEAEYIRFADAFLKWHRRYISETRSEAARKRWGQGEAGVNQSAADSFPSSPKKS
jgi:hypothetical protein